MENQTNNSDFTELRSLLQEKATMLPHCDLEDGFLHDLHTKLRSDNMKRSSLSLFWERLNTHIENLINPSAAWGGAAFAAVAMALGLTLFFNGAETQNEGSVASSEVNDGKLERVKSDNKIDFEGAVPAFLDESDDF